MRFMSVSTEIIIPSGRKPAYFFVLISPQMGMYPFLMAISSDIKLLFHLHCTYHNELLIPHWKSTASKLLQKLIVSKAELQKAQSSLVPQTDTRFRNGYSGSYSNDQSGIP